MIDDDLFKLDDQVEEESTVGFGDFVHAFFEGATFGLLTVAERLMGHNDHVATLKSEIGKISSQFNANDFLQTILQNKEIIIDKVKEKYQAELLQPIKIELEECLKNLENKEQTLEKAKQNKELLLESKNKVIEQIQEMSNLL